MGSVPQPAPPGSVGRHVPGGGVDGRRGPTRAEDAFYAIAEIVRSPESIALADALAKMGQERNQIPLAYSRRYPCASRTDLHLSAAKTSHTPLCQPHSARSHRWTSPVVG